MANKDKYKSTQDIAYLRQRLINLSEAL